MVNSLSHVEFTLCVSVPPDHLACEKRKWLWFLASAVDHCLVLGPHDYCLHSFCLQFMNIVSNTLPLTSAVPVDKVNLLLLLGNLL